MKKIYIHVGPYKTGTTSIQNFFYANRQFFLDEYQILYPGFLPDHGPIFRNAFASEPELFHNNIIATKSRSDIKNEVDSYLEKFITEVKNTSFNTLLISGEHISDLKENELFKLHEFLSMISSDIEIIYFVREPRALITSDLQESVKSGRATAEKWKFDYIIDRYYSKINIFSKVFSKDNLHLVRFEDAIMASGGLNQYFCNRFFEIEFIDKNEIISNTSTNDLGFKFLEILNRTQPSVLSGKPNNKRSKSLIKFLKDQRGSKINFPLSFDEVFIKKINSALDKLSKEFSITYPHFENTDDIDFNKRLTFDNNDLECFINDLNSLLFSYEQQREQHAFLLRDAALRLEKYDVVEAFELMTKAHKLKPNGPFIMAKLEEYRKAIQSIDINAK